MSPPETPSTSDEPSLAIIVPCYNEGARLSTEALTELLRPHPRAHLFLVDDGSTDNTAERMRAFAAEHPGRVDILSLDDNYGKAEAVRRGMRLACDHSHDFVGYLDADMATPPSELLRLFRVARDQDRDVVLGSRVALLGRTIERSFTRHLLGRVFATSASLILRTRLYDTQCGAKVFRRTEALVAALAEPFVSRWAFDVELLGRLFIGAPGSPGLSIARVVEEPLTSWRDVPGSKLHPVQMARVVSDLLRIQRDLEQRRLARIFHQAAR